MTDVVILIPQVLDSVFTQNVCMLNKDLYKNKSEHHLCSEITEKNFLV